MNYIIPLQARKAAVQFVLLIFYLQDPYYSAGEESCGSVRFDIPLVTRTEFHSSQPKQYTWSPLDSDSGDSVTQQFLKPPPRQRERKPRRKKRKHNHTGK